MRYKLFLLVFFTEKFRQQSNHLEFLEGPAQCFDGFNIQVVGGFVENQEVRSSRAQNGEGHSRFLASGQTGNGLQGQIARHTESTQQSSIFFHRFSWSNYIFAFSFAAFVPFFVNNKYIIFQFQKWINIFLYSIQ